MLVMVLNSISFSPLSVILSIYLLLSLPLSDSFLFSRSVGLFLYRSASSLSLSLCVSLSLSPSLSVSLSHSLFVSLSLSLSLPGVNIQLDLAGLKAEVPHIIVGTPGRVMDLATKRKVSPEIHSDVVSLPYYHLFLSPIILLCLYFSSLYLILNFSLSLSLSLSLYLSLSSVRFKSKYSFEEDPGSNNFHNDD